MSWGVILRNLILGLTALSCGFILWLTGTNVRAALRFRDWAPAFYAMARSGLVIVIGLVADAILATPDIPVNVRTVLYTLGLLLVAIGYAGILVFESKRPHHEVDRKVM